MRATNRQILPVDSPKVDKFPRTARRAERIAHVLSRRQPSLTVVLENVHDPHNVGAVLRACDAVGTLGVHTVYTIERRPAKAYARSTSGSASKWIEIYRHESIETCYQVLRSAGHQIAVAALTDERNEDLYDMSFLTPTAIVFGNEKRGASEEAIRGADVSITIPMMGMVESLNISVACAVTLFEALRQMREAGQYDVPRLPRDLIDSIGQDWLKR